MNSLHLQSVELQGIILEGEARRRESPYFEGDVPDKCATNFRHSHHESENDTVETSIPLIFSEVFLSSSQLFL